MNPSKRLVVCCDGTWNEALEDESPTNVVKTVRAICPVDEQGTPQVVYYDPGVGTGNTWDRLVGGGFGVGLSRNVQEAYLFLVSNYQEGDEIYLFGFSRGAFTVRSLAGLIGLAGILCKRDMAKFPEVYAYYRTPPEERTPELERRLLGDKVDRKEADIHFLGVWDTVGALGIPFGPLRFVARHRYAFHDVHLGDRVRHAYHALAMDERRRSFAPSLWTKVPHPERQAVEQVWFPGAHANVGGGYANAGLSNVAWLWMMEKASRCELFLDRSYADEITKPRPPSALHDSRTLTWKLRTPLEREVLATHPASERVHASVLERMTASDGITPAPYDPQNLRKARDRLGPDFDRAVVHDRNERLAKRPEVAA